MVRDKTREEVIFQALSEFKRRYKAAGMFLLVKDEFLDIMTIEQKSFSGNSQQNFLNLKEDDLFRFKKDIIEMVERLDIGSLISKYWSKKFVFDFEFFDHGENFVLNWWLKVGAPGNAFFERPGAIIIRDVKDYWVIALLSHETMVRQNYETQLKALDDVIQQLDAAH